MDIVWQGSPNFQQGRNGQKIVAIVDHIMSGTMESTDGWFKNVSSQVSAHYAVSKDGRVWQYVKDEDEAWANGIWQSPDMNVRWLANAFRAGINPNYLTLSIEHEGLTGQPMPEAQYQATLALHRVLMAKWGIPADRQYLIGHYQITARDRANCPGSMFPWTRLMQDLSQTAQPPAPDQNIRYFENTGFYVNNDYSFLEYWNSKGGLEEFGYPIEGAHYDPAKDAIVQLFERSRFENHAKAPGIENVQLGLLGSEDKTEGR